MKRYVVETCYRFYKRIYEHKRDIRRTDMNDGLVKYNLETNHSFDFKDSKLLVYIHFKKYREMSESRIVSNYNTINQKPDFFNVTSYLVR